MFQVKNRSAMELFLTRTTKKIKELLRNPSSAKALDFPISKRLWTSEGLDEFDKAYEEYESAKKKGEPTDRYLQAMNEAILKLLNKKNKYQDDYEYLIEGRRIITTFLGIDRETNKVNIDTGESEEA